MRSARLNVCCFICLSQSLHTITLLFSSLAFPCLYLGPSVHNHSHMCSACRASRATGRLSSLSPFHPDSSHPPSRLTQTEHTDREGGGVPCMCDCELPAELQTPSPAGSELTAERDTRRGRKREGDSVVLLVWSALTQLLGC